MDLASLNADLLRAFPVLSETAAAWPAPPSREEFASLAERLAEAGIVESVGELVVAALEAHLRRSVAPAFWRGFAPAPDSAAEGFERFVAAVAGLRDALRRLAPVAARLELLGERGAVERLAELARAALLARLPPNFGALVAQFYSTAFGPLRAAAAEDEQPDSSENDLSTGECPGCGAEGERTECARCERTARLFDETNAILRETGLLERLAGETLAELVRDEVEAHVRETCKGSFDAPHLASLERWLESRVGAWLLRVRGPGPAPRAFLREAFARARIEQLFNVVIEYPDSQPAVDDLKACLRPEMRAPLAQRLRAALETRLLHPGVNTPDVLTAYVAAIRALRDLDPSGVLSVTATRPVREYLRTRDDTVRSVVSGLTEDGPGGGELAEELARAGGDEAAPHDADADEDTDWDAWRPDPRDADPNASSKYRRSGDVISTLVDVYGSKELFVNEYRTLLADRLLAQGPRDAERERRHLELLKRRFGESQLHLCEVMLKDVSDSKRINSFIRRDAGETTDGGFSCDALVLSAQFWPPFKDDSLEPPPEVRERLDAYTRAFEALKGNRTLAWKPHLGVVELEIEFGGRTLELSVSPMQATIIAHFERKPRWRLDELGQVTKATATALRRKMTYWQSLGIISAVGPDEYQLNEESKASGGPAASSKKQQRHEMICEEDEESPMASASDQREGELQVFWSYIVGMLTNLDSMPLERIHQMLKMFASQTPDTECSLQELRHFLETKVRNHHLILQGGLYKLPKS